jgi:hypothetical protein
MKIDKNWDFPAELSLQPLQPFNHWKPSGIQTIQTGAEAR